MNEKLVHLKIKIKSLVDESKNIRKEANKTSGMAKWNLNHHRKTIVRSRIASGGKGCPQGNEVLGFAVDPSF